MEICCCCLGIVTGKQRNAEIAGDLQISGACSGCFAYSTSSDSVALSTSDGANTQQTVSCSGNDIAIAGGFIARDNGTGNPIAQNGGAYAATESRQVSTSTWSATVLCGNSSGCPAGTFFVTATCLGQ